MPQLLAVLRDGHRDVALQAFELTQALIEQHPAARGALLQADVVKVGGCPRTVADPAHIHDRCCHDTYRANSVPLQMQHAVHVVRAVTTCVDLE